MGVSSCSTIRAAAAASAIASDGAPGDLERPGAAGRDRDSGAPSSSTSWAACGLRTRTVVPAARATTSATEASRAHATPDDDEVVSGQSHLAHEVRGKEHGASLARQRAHQVAHPHHPLGVQAVDRLVQQQGFRSPSRAAAIPSRWPIPREKPPTRWRRRARARSSR